MRLAPAAEFAVRGILVLADRYGQGPVSIDTICASRDLAKQYLTKIFAALAKANLIVPMRGAHGGYVLARPPDQVSVLEVIEVIEGPLCMNFCQNEVPQCEREECLLRPVWADIQSFVRNRLSSVKLSDCLARDTVKAAP
jgi:Rrf2 family protein